MKDKVDSKTLRLFSYLIFTMSVSVMISMLSPIVRFFSTGKVNEANQMNNDIYMVFYFIMFISIVGILSCLYHMARISKWFGYACDFTVAYIISEATVFLLRWIYGLSDDSLIFKFFINVISLIPTLCIMFMIVMILYGASIEYIEMKKKKRSLACKKTEVYCIAAFAVQILLNIFVNIETQTEALSIAFNIITVVIYLYNMLVMILLYMNVKRFCFDYYLNSYNLT